MFRRLLSYILFILLFLFHFFKIVHKEITSKVVSGKIGEIYMDCAGNPYPDIHGAILVQSGAKSSGGRKSRYKNFLRKSY